MPRIKLEGPLALLITQIQGDINETQSAAAKEQQAIASLVNSHPPIRDRVQALAEINARETAKKQDQSRILIAMGYPPNALLDWEGAQPIIVVPELPKGPELVKE